MKAQNTKNFVIKKTAQMSFWAAVSRLMGIAREVIQAQLLGVTEFSDAFFGASEIPNRFRKIFEDGGITSALVPHLVRIAYEGDKKRASDLVSAVLLIFDALLFVCCLVVWAVPEKIVYIASPGFSGERLALASGFIQWMFPALLFLAGSSIVSSALQAVNQFFIPAMGPAIYNAAYLGCLWACLRYGTGLLPAIMLVASGAKFLSRLAAYYWLGFRLQWPSSACLHDVGTVIGRFIPGLLSFGAVEFSFLVNKRLASFLAKGSVTLLYYAERFSMVPYSILGVALATVLLSHFSVAALKNPKRLPFLLLESSKLAVWFALPAMAVMMFISGPLFTDVMLKGRATTQDMAVAAKLLSILLCALPFQVLNKIMVSVFYAKHDLFSPMVIVILTMVVSTGCNYIFVGKLGIYVMALSLLFATLLKTILLVVLLKRKHSIEWPLTRFFYAFKNMLFQFSIGVCIFKILYATLCRLGAASAVSSFFAEGCGGYWIIVAGSFCITLMILWLTLRRFGVRLYLLPHYTDV